MWLASHSRRMQLYETCIADSLRFAQCQKNIGKQSRRKICKFAVAICKVLSLLEACFDLISDSSPHMKIQIMGGKLLKIWGSNPRSGRSKVWDDERW